ncbi:MAG: GNAT family N-acetyltransferase [Polyangiaceae bacterium]|jgi:ribosomal protein S18 acetylase RimI-like enzyme
MTVWTKDGALIRVLRGEDATAFRAIRLRALREDPTPFLSTYAEEANETVEQTALRLAAGSPGTEVLGAFRADLLIGTLGFYRHTRTKARHRASLWGMYVAPEERRRGVAAALLEEAVGRLSALGDVKQVELNVVHTETPARQLYLAAGFDVQGSLQRAMKEGERYFDEDLMILRLS